MKIFKYWLVAMILAGSLNGWIIKLASTNDLEKPGMIFIPAGEFLMGSEEGNGRSDEYPQHKVYLDEFYIDRFETTGKNFEEYLSNLDWIKLWSKHHGKRTLNKLLPFKS